MATGFVENRVIWSRGKAYSFGLLRECFANGIMPTDVDGIAMVSETTFSVHTEKRDHFLWIEMKTNEAPLPRGQARFYAGLLRALRDRATLFILRHPELSQDVIDMSHVQSLQVVRYLDRKLCSTPVIPCDLGVLQGWFNSWYLNSVGLPSQYFRKLKTAGLK